MILSLVREAAALAVLSGLFGGVVTLCSLLG